MDSLQARLDTFAKGKKTKSSGKTIRWPHPSTYLATPDTLAEAGFYYNPTSEYRDNVVCFICAKELSDWDAEDDPFDIHWSKCKMTCAWATVRCGLKEDLDESGNYEFSDPARVPSSKTMEKARLETFAFNKSWPHDSVKGHGASSKKMAKAGFVYTPQSSGDDTATCFYCSLALSGWDVDDNPTDEHHKREKKAGPCPFFTATARSLSKSTSRPSSKLSSRVKAYDDQVIVLDSDDELASVPAPSSTSKGRRTKTPASRRSTRGTGSRVGTEVEDTDAASGSDTGKRVSKTKRKGTRRITVIEEVEEAEAPVREVAVKPKRGRPPKASKAKPEPEPESALDETDLELPVPPPHPKKPYARTRSKANVESESEAPKAGSSNLTHFTAKSGLQVTPIPDEPALGSKGSKRKAKKVGEDLEPPSDAAPKRTGKSKGRAVSKTASKKALETEDDREPVGEFEVEQLPLAIAPEARAATVEMEEVHKPKPKHRQMRQPPVFNDAQHVMPQPPPPAHANRDDMDVDEATKPENSSRVPNASAELSTSSERAKPGASKESSTRADSGVYVDVLQARSRPAESSSSRSSSRSSALGGRGNSVFLSRTSSMSHSLNGRAARETLKVVDVSSDEDDMNVVPPTTHPSEDVRMSAEPTTYADDDTIVLPSNDKESKQKADAITLEPEAPVVQTMLSKEDIQLNGRNETEGEGALRDIDAAGLQAIIPLLPSTRTQPHETLSPIPQSPPLGTFAEVQDMSEDIFTPLMSLLPIHQINSLTDEEELMTLEQYVRREIELQYQQFKADGERRITEFRKKATEAKRIIEAS